MLPVKASGARASRNCGNCRAVKRRCDQQFPYCGQCIRTRESCPGYRDEWDLVFRDQTKHTIKRFRETRVKNVGPIRVVRSPIPIRSLGPSLDEIGIQCFLYHFVADGQPSSHGYMNIASAIDCDDATYPTLAASMAAVGLAALAKASQQTELASRARVQYANAIEGVNSALASPTESLKDNILMSVISLGLFDFTSSFESWLQHIQGAAALVVRRGKSQFSSMASITMFNQVRADVVASCIQCLQPFPDDLLQLQEEASKHADCSSPAWIAGMLASRCATLLWRVREQQGGPKHDFLEQAIVLRHDLQRLSEALRKEEPYTVIHESDMDHEVAYQGRLDLYRSSWAIRVWNNIRILQTVVSEILLYLLHSCISTETELSVQSHLKQTLHETLQHLKKLGDDMLATLPQALGLVTPSVDQGSFVHYSQHARISGGHMMTWCLYTVGKSPIIKSETRRWIVRQLKKFEKGAGITMAIRFIEEIEEMSELGN